MKKFKVGDWIIGRENNPYPMTNSNTILEVLEPKNDDTIRGKVVVSFYEDIFKGQTFGLLAEHMFRKVTPEDIIRFNAARKEYKIL